MKKYLLGVMGCVMAGVVCAQQESAFPAFPPDDITAVMDRDQMFWQLGTGFPDNLPEPGSDPNRPSHIKPGQNAWQWTDDTGYLPQSPLGLLINRTPFGLWLNYKEEPASVGVYTPIDLLKAEDGTRITSAGQWWDKRRPELQKMCQEEIWGVIPEAAQDLKVTWDIRDVSVSDSVYGKFEEKSITGLVDISSYPALKHQPQIKGRLYLPVGAKNVPVVIQFAWFRFPPHPVYLQECISRGWGFLQMDCTALQPDNGAFLTDYLIGLVNKGNWRKPQDWGALAAWSWGVSRLIDFFETHDAFDAKRVGITGHSRYGKAALVTMAYEPRVAVAYVSCSGAGGASPIRRHWGQDLESVAWDTEYHWLAGNFMRWLGPLQKDGYLPRKYEELKVDAHALLALCAPRPVLITGGTTDYWCDSYGMYLTCRDASPAYELLGAKGVRMTDEQPVPDKDYVEGTIAYRYHEGWHVDYLDWPVFAEWASSHAMSNAGAFRTKEYRNLFAELGYPQAEIDARLNGIFHNLFEGPDKVYFEVGDSMAYISDIKNNDVRTEGMSYGMMIAVQFDRKDIFDRLWRWGTKYMQHHDGPLEGYFAWSCKLDGTRNSQGPASDGELYYVTALIFASNLWGNDTGIDYLKEAQYILDCSMAKDGTGRVTNFINMEHKLITFVPDINGGAFTDPSYHVPAFYEVWARWANDGRSALWQECADRSRAYLHKAVHPVTGLTPDYSEYDGTPHASNWVVGDAFRFDSWRVPMNIALDYSWACADKEWQQEYGHRIQDFLYSQGIDTFVDQYNVDGTMVTEILQAGEHKALRHSLGLVATSAAASLVCSHAKSREFVDRFWNAKNEPYSDGYFDAYYDGLLQLFAFMHLSGRYRIIFPR